MMEWNLLYTSVLVEYLDKQQTLFHFYHTFITGFTTYRWTFQPNLTHVEEETPFVLKKL